MRKYFAILLLQNLSFRWRDFFVHELMNIKAV